jgi:hypothetical protein
MNICGHEINEDGCGASSCSVRRPNGPGLNIGCQCLKHLTIKDKHIVMKALIVKFYPRKAKEDENKQH